MIFLESRRGRSSRSTRRAFIGEPSPAATGPTGRPYGLFGTKVLLVEDDTEVLDAMHLLLERWQCDVRTATHRRSAHPLGDTDWLPHIVIADQHLDGGELGSETILQARDYLGRRAGADCHRRRPRPSTSVRAAGIELMRKPVKPAQLRALLAHLLA